MPTDSANAALECAERIEHDAVHGAEFDSFMARAIIKELLDRETAKARLEGAIDEAGNVVQAIAKFGRIELEPAQSRLKQLVANLSALDKPQESTAAIIQAKEGK